MFICNSRNAAIGVKQSLFRVSVASGIERTPKLYRFQSLLKNTVYLCSIDSRNFISISPVIRVIAAFLFQQGSRAFANLPG